MIKVKNTNVFGDINTDSILKAMNQLFDFANGHEDVIVASAIMPDAHFGYGVPIGGVFAAKDMIFPSAVGFDIGCGMCAIPTSFTKADIEANKKDIWNDIQKAIPVGFNHNSEDQKRKNMEKAEELVSRFYEIED